MGQYYPDSLYTRPNYHSAVNVAVEDEKGLPPHSAGSREVREFINGLPTTVKVCTRSGLVYSLAPEPRSSARNFVVREQAAWALDTEIDRNVLAHTSGPTAKAWVEASLRVDKPTHFKHESKAIITEISWHDFMTHGKTLYLEECDVVISIDPKSVLVHPYSEHGFANRVVDSIYESNVPGTASLVLRIVDPASKLSPKFANICGDIYRVPAVTADVPEGLYVIRNGFTTGGAAQEATVEHIELANIEEHFMLYDSYEAAKILGDTGKALDHERERENQQLKAEAQIHRNEELDLKRLLQQQDHDHKEKLRSWEIEKRERDEAYEREKREFEESKRKSEDELRRRKEALDAIQIEMESRQLIRKDVYEERSYERKDNLEYLKFLPLALAGIMGLVLAFKKS